MAEVVGALLRSDVSEDQSDTVPQGVDGTLGGLPQGVFEPGEGQLDGAEVWRVGRQEEKLGALGLDASPL